MSKTQTLLVLGSNGFIGKNAVEYYSRAGYRVLSPKRQELELVETQAVEAYLREHRPDLVLMSAVKLNALDDNMRVHFNLERCSELYGRMISIGSGAEYDRAHYHPMMSEDYFGQHVPGDSYGLSKYLISHDVEKQRKNMYNLRVFGIFGKYEDYRRRFISNNICRALAGLGISMNRDMRFDFLYVDDFLRVAERLFVGEPEHRNYNLCSSEPVELRALAEMIRERHGATEPVSVRQTGRNGEYSGDNSRLVQEFGALSLRDMKSCVFELYDWYAQHPQLEAMCRELVAAEAAA